MFKKVLIFGAILLVCGARSGAAQEKKGEEANAREGEPRVTDPGPTGEFVVIDDHWWTTLLSDEPQLKLKDAAAQRKEGNLKEAALDIRKAAAHTRVAIARTKGKIKDDLVDSVRELDQLALRLEKGESVSPDTLDLAFGRDLQALAAHHAEKADRHWETHSGIKAGYELKAAALDLRAGAEWAGTEFLARVAPITEKAEDTADHLIKEEKVESKTVSQQLAEVEARLGELRDTLRRG
jgi:hypothetical protein